MSHAYPQLQLFINGQWLSSEGRKSEPVFNPVDESVLGDLPHASQADLQAALQAANGAFEGWKRTSPLARSDILRKAATLIRERATHIATCTDQRVSLVDKQNDRLRRRLDLIDHAFEAAFELTLDAGSGLQQPHVQR